MVARASGRRELLFNEYRVSVLQMKRVVEVDGGDGCNAVCMYLGPVNCTLKYG